MAARRFSDEQIAAAYTEHGTASAAAKALGMDRRGFVRRLRPLAEKGFSPAHNMPHLLPDGFAAARVSTYYNKDGKPTGQWLIGVRDEARQREIMRGIVDALAAELPRATPTPAPAGITGDLLNAYIITDYHMGMMAEAAETGGEWNMEIAEQMLVQWFSRALNEAPRARVGLLAQLGDFMHWDGWASVTPTSGHVLDAATRFPNLVAVASRALRTVITMMLERHEQVRIIMAEGNHDMASSIWLRHLMAAHFQNEPRVTVDMTQDPYYCHLHGNTVLFFHHGHKKRLDGIDDVFVRKYRREYGTATRAYAHTGHLHHSVVKETNLMKVEQHRTLAAPDAHASRGGWMSDRDAVVITYSAQHGERGRVTVPAELVAADMERAA